MIPKKFHFIWVGDESKCPHEWIRTWRDNHPSWEFSLWGNKELYQSHWVTRRQMEQFIADGQWAGVADCMRYEILLNQGGVYIDADSISVQPLDEQLLDNEMFASYSSETHFPGQIANGYIGSVARHPILEDMVDKIARNHNVLYEWSWWPPRIKKKNAWKTVGARLLTQTAARYASRIKVLPSVHFIPKHFLDVEERTHEKIYARQLYASTQNLYLSRKDSTN